MCFVELHALIGPRPPRRSDFLLCLGQGGGGFCMLGLRGRQLGFEGGLRAFEPGALDRRFLLRL